MSDIRNGVVHTSGEELVIDLYSVVMDVVKEWLSILLLALAAGILDFVVLTDYRPLEYATTATLVVNHANEHENVNRYSGNGV